MKKYLSSLIILTFIIPNLLGVTFIENRGQIADLEGRAIENILFQAEIGNAKLSFTKNSVIYISREFYRVKSEEADQARKVGNLSRADELELRTRSYRFDMILENTNPDVIVVGQDKNEAYSNYYYAHCPNGIMNVPHFSKITYNDIYPNIDLVFYNAESGLKYDFVVKPGGNWQDIAYYYDGIDDLTANEDGSMLVSSPLMKLTETAPYTYYINKGEKTEVQSAFKQLKNSLKFNVDEYPKGQTLVIDPSLVWSTYFDVQNIVADAISFTSTGDFFSSGYHYNYPAPLFNAGTWYDGTHNGSPTDILIIKFSSAGQQLWTTWYGGTNYEYLINNTSATDDNDNYYVSGQTSSSDFPLYNPGGGAFYDNTYSGSQAYILKFDKNGNRLWATYFSGSSGGDRIRGLITYNNTLYICGQTYNSTFPVQSMGSAYYDATANGSQDGFIAQFTSAGVKQWCTLFGGSGAEHLDDIWIDPTNNNMYLTGEIGGWSVPTTYPPLINPGGGAYFDNSVNGKQDVIIIRMNSSRQITWSTIYGGQSNDNINGDCGGVRTDGSGNAYVVGKTASNNLPLQNPGGGAYYQSSIGLNGVGDSGNDGFILKFSSAGVRRWASYYGGSGSEEFRKIKIDLSDNIWIGSFTTSANIPLLTKSGSYNQSYGGGNDALFINFNSAGVRQWATCYGGSGSEVCRPFGIYQASACGLQLVAYDYTASLNLPLLNPGAPAYYDNTLTGSYSNFIVKMTEGGGGGSATGTITWTGAVDEDWFDPCNWDKTAVPTASNPVVIPAGTTNKAHIFDNTQGNANCFTLQIVSQSSNAGHLTIHTTSGGRLNVTGP